MSAAPKIPPRYFVGPLAHPNGYAMYPVYDRRRLQERREPMQVLCWCSEKLNAENIAAAMNYMHSEAR